MVQILCYQCGNKFKPMRATAKYCSARCRKLAFQGTKVSVPENAKVIVPDISVPQPYELVPGELVYSRPAVKYPQHREQWDTRPEPDSPSDIPVKDTRGKYERANGACYQIDASGKAHVITTKSISEGVLPANYGQPAVTSTGSAGQL